MPQVRIISEQMPYSLSLCNAAVQLVHVLLNVLLCVASYCVRVVVC